MGWKTRKPSSSRSFEGIFQTWAPHHPRNKGVAGPGLSHLPPVFMQHHFCCHTTTSTRTFHLLASPMHTPDTNSGHLICYLSDESTCTSSLFGPRLPVAACPNPWRTFLDI